MFFHQRDVKPLMITNFFSPPLLALMADASDDALSFTRGVDSWETFDPSSVNADVYCFLIRIVELCVDVKMCTM